MIARGIPLEINTAGLHHVGLTYPTAESVEIYTAEGGRLLSIGSDGHEPAKLGYQYATAAEIALSKGLTHLCTWENRQKTEVPIVQN